jgi:hypothetical protein
LVTALLLTVGCDGLGTDPGSEAGFNTEVETQTVKADAVNIEQIDRGQYGNIVDGTQTVLRDQGEFASFWSDLHADQSTTPDLPAVDFESQVVVAVVLGERPNGGYEVEVDQVMANEDEAMRVEYTETVPGETCGVTQVLTSPYVLVTVDVEEQSVDPDEGVTFSSSEETRSC